MSVQHYRQKIYDGMCEFWWDTSISWYPMMHGSHALGQYFFIRPLEEIDKIVRKQMITVHVFVGLTSVMPPFFCQHFLWCSYLPFINPTSGYVCNDNGLHTDAAHLSVTGYNVSYWPSHPMAYPSSVFLALAHTFSIIN